MTDPETRPDAPPDALPKQPPPGLGARAPRPHAVRLRRSVVQVAVMGGAVLIAGSLAWAFVIQPDLRSTARARQAEARDERAHGVVRPSEAVTDQPASYDRLPEPRLGAMAADTQDEAANPPSTSISASDAPVHRAQDAPRAMEPGPREQALQSAVFFAQEERDQGGGLVARSPAPAPVPATGPAPATGSAGQAAGQDSGTVYNGHRLVAPLSPFELKAGAVVPAALLTAIDTARPGPVVAAVTQNVYDTVSGRHLLLPQGSRLIGRHEGDSAYGDRRAFLAWERLILPNGKSLILTDEPGVDAQGAVGVQGQVDRRLWPLVVGTLFAGAITTLGQIARDDDDGRAGGLLGDAGDAAAIEGSRVGGRLVDRELEVRPSIRLRAGAPVRVMITRDLVLEPYRP